MSQSRILFVIAIPIVREDHTRNQAGGWTLEDVQRFWRARGVWGAVNVDGGPSTQALWRRADGRHYLVPPTLISERLRVTVPASLKGAPPSGGGLMYFYVREVGR